VNHQHPILFNFSSSSLSFFLHQVHTFPQSNPENFKQIQKKNKKRTTFLPNPARQQPTTFATLSIEPNNNFHQFSSSFFPS
jgi:hypothetical protein